MATRILTKSPTFCGLSGKLKSALENPLYRVTQRSQRARSRSTRWEFYRYLSAVLRTRNEWGEAEICPLADRVLKEIAGKAQSAEVKLPRLLMDATAPWADAKTRSRWSRALDYAIVEGVTPKQLRIFFGRNGGVAGCARAIAKISPLKQKFGSDWD